MEMNLLQLLLICLYLALHVMETRGWEVVFMYSGAPVLGGFVTGLILGDPVTGLGIGASLQLMSLGVAAFGGAAVPDYHLGAVAGTMIAILTGKDLSYALTIAIPVSLLSVQIDIIARMGTAFFIQQARSAAEKLEMKKSYALIRCGVIPYMLRMILPIVLLYAVGGDAINRVLEMLPDPIMGTFRVVAGMLPAMGLAILLRYMNVKRYIPYLIGGFVVVAYLDMPILGVALLGGALAIASFMKETAAQSQTVQVGGGSEDEL